jgi:hypothetical protein
MSRLFNTSSMESVPTFVHSESILLNAKNPISCPVGRACPAVFALFATPDSLDSAPTGFLESGTVVSQAGEREAAGEASAKVYFAKLFFVKITGTMTSINRPVFPIALIYTLWYREIDVSKTNQTTVPATIQFQAHFSLLRNG